MRRRDFMVGFSVALGISIAANLLAFDFRSYGGSNDPSAVEDWIGATWRIGYPFQFFEEGGIVHDRVFSPVALILDVLLTVGCSAGVGIAYAWIRGRFPHERV